MAFTKAVKTKSKLRMAITGPSGSGKTFTALRVARGLGDKIALIDSEYRSASKYSDKFDFDTMDITRNDHPSVYEKAVRDAESAGYDVVIIDSITHAWESTQDIVDKKTAASTYGNSFTSWREGGKIWNSLLDCIKSSNIHVICTMRSKMDYIQDQDDKGKKRIRKVGMAPEVRNGTEYEYDMVLDLTIDHIGSITKTRCDNLDGYVEARPSEELGYTLKIWLSDGADAPVFDRDGALRALELIDGHREYLVHLKWLTVDQMPFELSNDQLGKVSKDIKRFTDNAKINLDRTKGASK